MRIVLVTDAWLPQMNGVVRTLQATTALLKRWGNEVLLISPEQYRSLPCPSYPEIRLALARSFSGLAIWGAPTGWTMISAPCRANQPAAPA